VRKVDASGVITTVAGNGTAGFSGDGGPATAAMLDTLNGIAVDGWGNLYIADQQNNRVRKVNTSGIITTVAGNGTMAFAGDGGPATAASLSLPSNVAADDAGNLFISDIYNFRIRKVNASGIITTFAGNGTHPTALGPLPGDGGPATAAMLGNWFRGLAIDGAGNLYLSSNYGARKVNTAGIISTVAGVNNTDAYGGDGGPAIAANLSETWDVALDGLGTLYISDAANYRVRKISGAAVPTTGIAPTLASTSSKFELLPNPNKGGFIIRGTLNSLQDGQLSVTITNMLGQTIYNSRIDARGGNFQAEIQLGVVPGGLYLAHIVNAGQDNQIRFEVLNY
jgi:hypothetical protein